MNTLRLLKFAAVFSIVGNGISLLSNEPPPPPPSENSNMHVETNSVAVTVSRKDTGDNEAHLSMQRIFVGLSAGVGKLEQSHYSLGSRNTRTYDSIDSKSVYLTEPAIEDLRDLVLQVLKESNANSKLEPSLLGEDHVLFEITVDGDSHLFSRKYPLSEPKEENLLSSMESVLGQLATTDKLRKESNEITFLEGGLVQPREVSVEELVLKAPEFANRRVAVSGRLKVDPMQEGFLAFLVPEGGAFSKENELPKKVFVDAWSPYSEKEGLEELSGSVVKVEGLFRLEEGLRLSVGSVTAIQRVK